MNAAVKTASFRYETANPCCPVQADDAAHTSERWLGAGPGARALRMLARQVADASCPVLIEGETGTGKGVLARYVHALSFRANAPFATINCAGLSPESARSRLFGCSSILQSAGSGTVLLDEIGDTDAKVQALLLNLFEDSAVRCPLTGVPIPVRARVMAASQRDLEKAVAEGAFRQDLFYRLDIIRIRIPPLRERREDILPLAEYLLRRHWRRGDPPPFTHKLHDGLLAYNWPGNVRELENVMWRLAVFGDVRIPQRAGSFSPPTSLAQLASETEQAEVGAILEALNKTWWNRRKAAALLQLDYRTLLYKMKKYGIEAVANA